MNGVSREGRNIPWKEKDARQKAATIGMIIGIFLACAILAYAAVKLCGSKSITLNNTKGHTFEMELIGMEGIEVIPGTEQLLSPAVVNKSTTDNVYCFIGFEYDENLYEITDVEGWELVENSPGHQVYSYSKGGIMEDVVMNNTAMFSGKMTCIAPIDTFLALEDSDLAVDITGYAICTAICSEANSEAWTDYQNAETTVDGD